MRRRWQALRGLRRQERIQLLEGAASVSFVWICMRAAGYSKTRSWLARTSCASFRSGYPSHGDAVVSETTARLAWSVAASAHYAPFTATCLHRSLALWWMLRRRGIDSDVRIGAAQTEQGMAAHAWLERNGVVLNDDENISQRFSPFADLR